MLPVYESLLNILAEAGFVLTVKNESALVSGAEVTTAFANYISVENTEAEVKPSDVKVIVDDEPATVVSLDAEKGKITLESAPEAGARVLVSYRYSPVSLDFVATTREDVASMIYAKMRGVDSCAPYDSCAVPNSIRMISRLWTAGLLLAKDYGYNADNELGSKDGYKKIEEAKALLEDFYKAGGCCGNSDQTDVNGGSGDILAAADGLFGRPGRGFCGDSCFERG